MVCLVIATENSTDIKIQKKKQTFLLTKHWDFNFMFPIALASNLVRRSRAHTYTIRIASQHSVALNLGGGTMKNR